MASDRPQEAPGHQQMSALLPAYELGVLSDEDREAFESHVLQCDACFQELERGAAVATELQANRSRFRRILEEAPAAGWRPREVKVRPSTLSWLRPQIAVPALAAAVAIFMLITRAPGPDYRKLASFPRQVTLPDAVRRGAGRDDAVRELMQAGAGYLDLGRFEEAERHFAAALDRDPGLADAAYFLGLSRVFRGDIDGALTPLERAVEIGTGNQPEYTWVLANAYLRAGQITKARETLLSLSAGGGEAGELEYVAKARDLLERLPD